MTIKLRSIYTGKLHLIADDQTAGTAHAGTIDHDRVHGNDGRDAEILCGEAGKLHHDDWSDGYALRVLLALFVDQLLQNVSYDTLLAVGAIICTYIDIGRYLTKILFHDQKVLISGAEDDIRLDAVLMQPLHLRINRCSTDTAGDEDERLLLQLLDRCVDHLGRSAERSYDIRERITGLQVAHLLGGSAHYLEYDGDGLRLSVVICDGKRNSLAQLSELRNHKLTRLTLHGNKWCLDDHKPVLVNKVLNFGYFVHDLLHVLRSLRFQSAERLLRLNHNIIIITFIFIISTKVSQGCCLFNDLIICKKRLPYRNRIFKMRREVNGIQGILPLCIYHRRCAMDELKQQDEERKLNQETTAAGKPVSNVDPRSREDDEPEIPEESRPNLTDLFESIPDDDKKSDDDDRSQIHTDTDDFDEDKADEPEREDELEELIDEGNKEEISEYYEEMQPADFVEEVDDLDDEDLQKLPKFLNTEQLTEIMEEADDDTRQRISEHLDDDTLLAMFEDMSKDDIVDILGEMEIAHQKRLLNRMKSGDRRIIHTLLQYPDDSAGGIMTTEYIALREDRTCAQALDTIRDIGPKTEVIETIYVTDEERLKKLVGTVDLRDLLSSPRNTKLSEIMDDQVVSVEPEVDQEEVAQVVSKYDLQAIPVVSSKGSILGIITVDDIIDVINEEHDEDIAHLGGTSAEEGLDTTLWESVRMRLPWLLINLLTAFLASFTVKMFESTIAKVVALSATMTIVSGMGGNAGTQTMSVMVRELANDEISFKENWKSFVKEILLGVVDGAATGLVTGIVVALLYGNVYLGIIIFLAMIGNLVVSGIFGFLVPLTLEKLHADPALASSIFVTTATDVLGFFIFLGLASAFLPYLE